MESIMEKIRKETDRDIEKIKTEYAGKEAAITSEAGKKAELHRKKILENAEKQAVSEQKRIVSAAMLESRKKKNDVVDAILESWIEEAAEGIEELRKETAYSRKLLELAKKAVLEIPSDNVLVLASKQDKAKLRGVKAKGKKIAVKESNELKTGVIVRASDKSVEINASFSNLLHDAKPEIKKELLELIEK